MSQQSFQRMVDRFLARADEVFPGNCTVVLYGSAARGDWVSGRSDLNLMLIADAIRPQDLARFGPEVGHFEMERMAPPYFVSRPEWERAGDAFPIEITDMRLAYRVLRGPDPIAGAEVQPRDLRRALEAELRGKLLRLRADYALYSGRPDLLAAVVAASAGSFRVLLRVLLVLARREPPADDPSLAAAIGALIGGPAEPLATAFAHRRDAAWSCQAPLFESYLAVVQQATRFVDTFTPGA
jgi:predicted nucleotidyltransferase